MVWGHDSSLSDRKSVLLQNIYLQFVPSQFGKTFHQKRILAITNHHLCLGISKVCISTDFKDYGITDTRKHGPFAPLVGQKNILIADGCRVDFMLVRNCVLVLSKEWTRDLGMFEKLIKAIDTRT